MRTALLSLWKYRRFLQPCSHPLVSQENKPLPFSPISATLNHLLLCTDTKKWLRCILSNGAIRVQGYFHQTTEIGKTPEDRYPVPGKARESP